MVLVLALLDVVIIVIGGDGDNVFVICLHDSCVDVRTELTHTADIASYIFTAVWPPSSSPYTVVWPLEPAAIKIDSALLCWGEDTWVVFP